MIKVLIVFAVTFILTWVFLISNKINNYSINIIHKAGFMPAEGINYTLDSPFVVQINNREITVPINFETDLASIPRILWPLFSPNDSDTVYPAILHDYLYSCGGWVSRKYADDVLYSFLIEQGYPKYKALPFYIAVRVFGSSHFEKRNKQCEFKYIGR